MQRNSLIEHANPNESISDSVCKAIEYYDNNAMKKVNEDGFFVNLFNSVSTIWKQDENNYIHQLRELIKKEGWFLEGDLNLLNRLKEIHQKFNTENDLISKKIFDYLEVRIEYLERKQHRSPNELTENYKILLVGDGWVDRSHRNNPVIKMINNLDKEKDKDEIENYNNSLNLKNRLYKPEQVYTIDINPAQLPDLCDRFENIKTDQLPNNFFDFIYFEGICFDNKEKTQIAVMNSFLLLKDDGLMIYSTPKPSAEKILVSKKNEITQDMLDKIPDSIKKSISRENHLDPLERVVLPNSNQVQIVHKKDENIYGNKPVINIMK